MKGVSVMKELRGFGFDKLLDSVQRDIDEANAQKRPMRKEAEFLEKLQWVIDRAKHYGEKLSLDWKSVLSSWSDDCNYWYMNYFQECNQPLITAQRTFVFETQDEMLLSIPSRTFRCPCCGGISTSPYECKGGNKNCNWKVYGLLGDLGKGAFVYCKDKLKGEKIFMPIEWERSRA